MVLLRGTLPCGRLVSATSDLPDKTNLTLISPQDYELNARQHMLDRSRVLVSRDNQKQRREQASVGEVAGQT